MSNNTSFMLQQNYCQTTHKTKIIITNLKKNEHIDWFISLQWEDKIIHIATLEWSIQKYTWKVKNSSKGKKKNTKHTTRRRLAIYAQDAAAQSSMI